MRLTLLCVPLFVSPALTQTAENVSGGALRPDQAAFDVEHYDLALTVDPESRTIEGTLTMHAAWLGGVESFGMELDSRLTVSALTLNGVPAEFAHEEGRLLVPSDSLTEGQTFSAAIQYGGQPLEAPRPPWQGGFTWAKTADGQPWIATSCQGEGADLWWPCKDHPSDKPDSMDIHVTVPDPLIVASNGRLLAVERAAEAGWSTHHWHVSTPIANYTVALNIAPYRVITTQFESVAGDEFPFSYWVLPENYEKGLAIFDEFQDHVRHMESICGPYPFRADKYGVAETPHLGMEHQSIIAYGNQYRGDPTFDYDWLHHHELAHEWWGNLVTAKDWNDFWIHEGVGTYVQALYLESRFGVEEYHQKMAIDLRRVLNKGAVAPRDERNTQQIYFAQEGSDAPGIDIYMKGSWICHTLRWHLGDEAFFRVLRRWAYPDPAMEHVVDGSHTRLATTDELIAIAEEHSGQELDWFFEVYLRRAALPKLNVEQANGELRLSWNAPDGLPFPLEVPVRVGDELRRVPMVEGAATLTVGDAEVSVDPDHWLLSER